MNEVRLGERLGSLLSLFEALQKATQGEPLDLFLGGKKGCSMVLQRKAMI